MVCFYPSQISVGKSLNKHNTVLFINIFTIDKTCSYIKHLVYKQKTHLAYLDFLFFSLQPENHQHTFPVIGGNSETVCESLSKLSYMITVQC